MKQEYRIYQDDSWEYCFKVVLVTIPERKYDTQPDWELEEHTLELDRYRSFDEALNAIRRELNKPSLCVFSVANPKPAAPSSRKA